MLKTLFEGNFANNQESSRQCGDEEDPAAPELVNIWNVDLFDVQGPRESSSQRLDTFVETRVAGTKRRIVLGDSAHEPVGKGLDHGVPQTVQNENRTREKVS